MIFYCDLQNFICNFILLNNFFIKTIILFFVSLLSILHNQKANQKSEVERPIIILKELVAFCLINTNY